jgi:hypothetical protein
MTVLLAPGTSYRAVDAARAAAFRNISYIKYIYKVDFSGRDGVLEVR